MAGVMSPLDEDALDEELDAMLARHGLDVPDSLLRGTRAGYRDLRRLADLLHAPRPAANEPSAVYRVRRWPE